MPKPRVLVIYKESAYSRYLSARQLNRHFKKGGYWNIIQGSHQRHHDTLKVVKKALRAEGLESKWVLRDRVQVLSRVDQSFQFVVSVGGDGTLLDSSHHIRKIPILGVNSDPQRSVARFSGCNAGTFRGVLKAYLQGKLKPSLVPRLEFLVNDRKNPWFVLNDLLVSTLSPAGTSRYVLKVGSRCEEQMSSGIWISTAAGSTAAILSAGGKVLPVNAKKFQFVVREAYQKKFGPRHLLQGVLPAAQGLEIVSRMKEGRIFVDGANLVVPFRLGDRLRVRLSNQPLKIVGLRN